jgi:general secretion pathway protein H
MVGENGAHPVMDGLAGLARPSTSFPELRWKDVDGRPSPAMTMADMRSARGYFHRRAWKLAQWTPDPPAGPTQPHGFTLIEMIVVLVVVALVAGLVMTRGPMRSRALEARTAAHAIAQSLRDARARAIAANRPVEFTLDLGRQSFRIDAGAVSELPPGLGLSVADVPGESFDSRIAGIRFAPDGSSSGGRIEVESGKLRFSIGVDWLTGGVSIADAQ